MKHLKLNILINHYIRLKVALSGISLSNFIILYTRSGDITES